MLEKIWWKEEVIYQIYPKSFYDSNCDGVGDLKGIIEKLDYLEELGVTSLWICPIFKSPMIDNGYDISDYVGIHEEFGSMEDLDVLV
ncbi:MAG: alpha-amylase family glycosyl hydrolase, partial [Cetobacterium sp.]